jgi:hypothetical protein
MSPGREQREGTGDLAVAEPGSNGGARVRMSKAARAAELKVSQVQTTKATSSEVAIRTDDRLGGGGP